MDNIASLIIIAIIAAIVIALIWMATTRSGTYTQPYYQPGLYSRYTVSMATNFRASPVTPIPETLPLLPVSGAVDVGGIPINPEVVAIL